MRLLCGCILIGLLGCSQPDRDNPFDPVNIAKEGPSLRLIAELPVNATRLAEEAARLELIRYRVNGPGQRTLTGTMNLVGGQAQARIERITPGADRVFSVEGFDIDQVRIYAGQDTLDIADNGPDEVRFDLQRLRGEVELIISLPPELVDLSIDVLADGDTLSHDFALEERSPNRVTDVPTGTRIPLVVRGRDAAGQTRLERRLLADVREGLVTHLQLDLEAGALEVEARFPEFLPIVAVDRFSDAATFFRRSEQVGLPAADAAIDFDQRFLYVGKGPNGERVEFYHFDVQTTQPAPIYILIDRRGVPIPGQLPIIDELPGEPAYNDLRRIHQARVTSLEYQPNSINSLEALLAAGIEIVETEEGMNCVVVPDGSKATRRLDDQTPTQLQDAWYQGQIVKFLLFEGPQSTAPIILGSGAVDTPQMFGFFDNDRDVRDGFALDPVTRETHNVIAVLPGDDAYVPLWVLQIFKLAAFDRIQSLADAIREDPENTIDIGLVHINAPIVDISREEEGG